MISSFKRLWRDRRGNALAIAGAALPLVLGSAGLASDTIQWTLWKRQLQRTADSAAMAGVYAIASEKAVGNCSNIAAATYADPVAYDIRKNLKVLITPTCTVTNPPSVGGYTADEHAVRVSLSVQKRLAFSGMFMSDAPVINAISTATIVPSGKYCVVSLEDQSYTGIDASGATGLNLGCGMITNSTSMSAAVATGSATVTASPIAAVGGIPASNNWGSGTILQPFTVQQEDPFANVPVPTPSSCNPFSTYDVGGNNKPNRPVVDLSAQTGTICIKEGGSGVLSIQGDVILGAATYILDSTSLTMGSNDASLKCNGCTIILTTSGTDMSKIGNVSITGGELDLIAPSTGCTLGTAGCYDGIMIYQDRRADDLNNVKINGNSASKLEGAFYFPKANMTFTGTSGQDTNCMQIVSKRVTFNGNSGISNVCPTGSKAKSFVGKKVRLVE